jgi:hypothetical protein
MESAFEGFLIEATAPDRTLAIVDDSQPGPVEDLFTEAFGSLDVDLEISTTEEKSSRAVVLVEDGEVVATSPITALRNAVLLVNSDLYASGLSGIERHEAPDVLTELDESVYTLRGFPESTKEKLLLVVMSRYIEARALDVRDGRLDVAFQKLSRIDDEYGTGKVYERLSRTDIDVHLYGVPDVRPTGLDGATIHTGWDERYRKSWFVVFGPPSGAQAEPAALVAVEVDENVWRSRWTYDPDRVTEIQERIVDRF